MRAPCSSATRSRCDMEGLLELLECAVEPRGAVRGGDAEHARRRARVDLEHDAKCDHLALACRQRLDGGFELGREPFGEMLLEALVRRGQLLAFRPAALGAEVVERDG